MTTFRDRLQRRARRAKIPVTPELGRKLEDYYHLITAWNSKVNLTGLNLAEQGPEALDRLLIEPLVASRHVPPSAVRVLDIGSGCGSPAIPMALGTPVLRVQMVEAKTRKSVFLREAVRTLGLEGRCEVLSSRFEELLARPDLHEAQDLLTIRAVRVEPRVLMGLQAFVRPGGLLFLFLGRSSSNMTEMIHPPLGWRATFPLLESSGSRLVVLEKRPIGR